MRAGRRGSGAEGDRWKGASYLRQRLKKKKGQGMVETAWWCFRHDCDCRPIHSEGALISFVLHLRAAGPQHGWRNGGGIEIPNAFVPTEALLRNRCGAFAPRVTNLI